MELSLTFDIDSNKEDISADFWNAHHSSWKDHENPTNFELENSIKNEINSWLEDLGVDLVMKQYLVIHLEEVYEHVFGDDAINRYTHEELIARLDEMYDCYKQIVDNSDNKQQQTIDVLWEFISEKDINAIMQKLKEKNL